MDVMSLTNRPTCTAASPLPVKQGTARVSVCRLLVIIRHKKTLRDDIISNVL